RAWSAEKPTWNCLRRPSTSAAEPPTYGLATELLLRARFPCRRKRARAKAELQEEDPFSRTPLACAISISRDTRPARQRRAAKRVMERVGAENPTLHSRSCVSLIGWGRPGGVR